jgi:hypothetical protein
MSYDSQFKSQYPPKTLDLLSSLGRFLTPDNSASHEETATQAADSRTTPNGVNPFQSSNEKDFLSIRPPSSYHELEKTFENQVRSPVMKKMRMDTARVGSSSCSHINSPEHRDLSDHRLRVALSQGNVALEPVDTRQPAFEHKEIAADNDANPKNRNSLACKPSSDHYRQFLRLEFDYETLRACNKLSEDQMIILEIQKLSPGRRMIIQEANFQDALGLFKNCYQIMTKQSPCELRRKFPTTNPRRYYFKIHFNVLWDNEAVWFSFWDQRADSVGLQLAFPTQQTNSTNFMRLRKLSLIFLYYAAMIDSIIPKTEERSSSLYNHNSEFFQSAIDIIQTIKNSREDFLDLDGFTNYNKTLWSLLKIWLDKSGRENVRSFFFSNHHSAQIFQIFFTKIFCLSIERYNEKLLRN